MVKTKMVKYKTIKGILVAGLLVFAMLYESTMFTEVLFSFQTACFGYSVFSCTGEERLQFLADVRQYAAEENVPVFSVARRQGGNITTIRVFTDDDSVRTQLQKNGIREKTYTTPLYGMVNVVFLPFDELRHDMYRDVNFISYAGNGENANHLYGRLSEKYNINEPSRTQGGVKDLVAVVWAAAAAMLVFMTVCEISGYRTAVAEELRNGGEVSNIMRRLILPEAGVDLLEFLLAGGILSLMYPGQVLPHLGAGIYTAAVLVSCLSYSYFAFFRWEKLYTGQKKQTGAVKPVLAAVFFLFAVNQSLTNRLNDQIVRDMKKEKSGKWYQKEMDGYTLIADKASLFSFTGKVNIEYYKIPDSSIAYLYFEAHPDKLGGISYIFVGFETTDGSGGIAFLDRHGNYLQPSPEYMESTKNARKLIGKYRGHVDEVIRIANEQWGLGIE